MILESFQLMTKVQYATAGVNVKEQAFDSMLYAVNRYGLTPESFVKVDQSC